MNRIDSYITKIMFLLRRLRFSWHLFFDLGICHKQQCTGYRHYSNSFRDSLRVRDVSECSDRCAETSYCKTFSFRHGVESSLELNCLLSSYSNFLCVWHQLINYKRFFYSMMHIKNKPNFSTLFSNSIANRIKKRQA